MRTKRLIATGVAVMASAVFFAACGNSDKAEETTTTTAEAMVQPTKDIVALASATPDLSTLVTAVTAADLGATLQGEGPFTVFAPTNEAFAALPKDKLDALLADKTKLAKVLTYHVVSGNVMAKDVAGLPDVSTGASVATVEGSKATIKFDGTTVTIDGAKVTTADVEATNGVVHIIDKVILPPGVTL